MKQYFTFIARNWASLGFGFICVFWGNFGQSFYLGGYGSAIKADLSLSSQAYGAIYSGATLCSAMLMFWSGVWIDRWRLRSFVIFVCLGLFAACVSMSLVQNAYQLFGAFILIRLFGQALLPHTGITTTAREFSTNRGKALSVVGCANPVGEIILPLCLLAFLVSYSWRFSWIAIAFSIPLCVLPLLLFLHKKAAAQTLKANNKQQAKDGTNKADTKKDGRLLLLRDKRFWFAAPIYWASPFFLTAFFIHQDFVLAQKNWSISWMATCFIVYGVVHWLGAIYSGWLVDRFTGIQMMRFYTLPLMLALFALANFEGLWVLPLVMTLMALSAGAAGPVMGSVWAEVYGSHNLGGVRAASGTSVVLATSLSPILFGGFIDIGVSAFVLFNISGLFILFATAGLTFSYSS